MTSFGFVGFFCILLFVVLVVVVAIVVLVCLTVMIKTNKIPKDLLATFFLWPERKKTAKEEANAV